MYLPTKQNKIATVCWIPNHWKTKILNNIKLLGSGLAKKIYLYLSIDSPPPKKKSLRSVIYFDDYQNE
jgi:hypothetical protein